MTSLLRPSCTFQLNLSPRWHSPRTRFHTNEPAYRHPMPTTCWRGCAWSAGGGVCPLLIPGAKQSKEAKPKNGTESWPGGPRSTEREPRTSTRLNKPHSFGGLWPNRPLLFRFAGLRGRRATCPTTPCAMEWPALGPQQNGTNYAGKL